LEKKPKKVPYWDANTDPGFKKKLPFWDANKDLGIRNPRSLLPHLPLQKNAVNFFVVNSSMVFQKKSKKENWRQYNYFEATCN